MALRPWKIVILITFHADTSFSYYKSSIAKYRLYYLRDEYFLRRAFHVIYGLLIFESSSR